MFGHIFRSRFFQCPYHIPRRCLNLLEYQSKELLEKHGVHVQQFRVAGDIDEANRVLSDFDRAEYVVKAQILAGGRGKGTFDNGFKSGVHITRNKQEAATLVDTMSGHRLFTRQTTADGSLVSKVMIAESVDIARETYFCIVMDRAHNGPVVVASPEGGVDIEEVCSQRPDRMRTYPVDIDTGVTHRLARDIARFLEFDTAATEKAAHEIMSLWRLFLSVDATQVEINPLIETTQGDVIAVDAKMQFDDNAKFRQHAIFGLEDTSACDSTEIKAAENNLNYIKMDGNIGCLVNGAGLAMATMDIIKLHGGQPANFLDCGGSVREAQVEEAFQLLLSDKNVKAILVNVFGGIVDCAMIANGIVSASQKIGLNIPLIVRLEGTNVGEARRILTASNVAVQTASHLDDAASKAVASIR